MDNTYISKNRVRLQSRFSEVMKSGFDRFGGSLGHFLVQARQIEPLRETFLQLETLLSEEDKSTVLNVPLQSTIQDPEDSAERAAFYLLLCDEAAKRGNPDTRRALHLMQIMAPREGNFTAIVSAFKDQALSPLYHYLDEKLDDGDFLLSVLLRYKRMVEWFSHEDLERQSASLQGKWPEAMLDCNLRRFLMEQGISYPFSEVPTRDGRVDIVAMHQDEPLPIEVKVYDGINRKEAQVRQGIEQAADYADKYHKPFGYLVAFNVSETASLKFQNSSGEAVPRVRHGNKEVFCIQVQVRSLGAPSKRQPNYVDV